MGVLDIPVSGLFRRKAEPAAAHRDEVRAQTRSDLFDRSRAAIPVLLLLLLVLRWAMNAAFSAEHSLLVPFVFLVLLSLVRLALALIPAPIRDALAGPRLQLLVFAAGVGLTSLALGMLIMLSWPFLDHVHIAILAAIVVGIASSALPSLGFHPAFYALYMLPMAVALFVMASTDPHPSWGAEILAAFSVLDALILLAISRGLGRSHSRAIELVLKVADLAVRDNLTRLHNRRFLQEYMAVEGARLAREISCWKTEADAVLGVFMVDLDRFREVNDSGGHEAGDAVLRQTAAALVETVRKSDILVRWGGEEFVVIARIRHRDHVRIVAEKLRRTIEALEFRVPQRPPLRRTGSLGYCLLPFFPQSPLPLTWEQALRMAEAALAIAKAEGRNRCVGVACGEKSAEETAAAFVKIVHDLKRASAQGYIVLDRGDAAG